MIGQFELEGELLECIPYGSGHINDTYRLTYETGDGQTRYILQRMNKSIFKNPQELMENISGVTGWLREKSPESRRRSAAGNLKSCKKTRQGILIMWTARENTGESIFS